MLLLCAPGGFFACFCLVWFVIVIWFRCFVVVVFLVVFFFFKAKLVDRERYIQKRSSHSVSVLADYHILA